MNIKLPFCGCSMTQSSLIWWVEQQHMRRIIGNWLNSSRSCDSIAWHKKNKCIWITCTGTRARAIHFMICSLAAHTNERRQRRQKERATKAASKKRRRRNCFFLLKNKRVEIIDTCLLFHMKNCRWKTVFNDTYSVVYTTIIMPHMLHILSYYGIKVEWRCQWWWWCWWRCCWRSTIQLFIWVVLHMAPLLLLSLLSCQTLFVVRKPFHISVFCAVCVYP